MRVIIENDDGKVDIECDNIANFAMILGVLNNDN